MSYTATMKSVDTEKALAQLSEGLISFLITLLKISKP